MRTRIFSRDWGLFANLHEKEQILLQGKKFVFSRQGDGE
jgi:hypothetical protein